MTAAFAPAIPDSPEKGALSTLAGAQTLLVLKDARQNYLAEALAIGVYALILVAALNYTTKPQQAPPEEPMELVMEAPPPPPIEEPKPPEPELAKPPEPQVEEPPPPPMAEKPAVAPVEPPKPKPPVVKVKPKPLPKPVVKQPVAPARPVAARPVAVAPVRAAPVPAGATASAIANQIHGCLARAGASLYPESQNPRSAHVGYRANISASGSVSYSWSSSGNPAFDSAAQRAGARCGSVAAPGRPAALSGVINFAGR
jgi:type IV secretory pathway VirB10-like protein